MSASSPDLQRMKLKQLRLPFAPINKLESASPSSSSSLPTSSSSAISVAGSLKPDELSSVSSGKKKRKVSESEYPESKLPRVQVSCESPRLSRRRCSGLSSLSSRPGSPQVVVSVVSEGEHPIAELQSSECASLRDKKKSVRVEIGRLTLLMIETKDAMDNAVDKQDFLLAQKHKLTLEELTERKEDLQKKLMEHGQDAKRLEALLKDIGETKKVTPGILPSPSIPFSSPEGTPSLSPKRKRKLSDEKRLRKEMEMKERENDKLEKLKKKEEERLLKERRREEERQEKEKRKESERLEKERKKESERQEKERKKESERLEKERRREEERLEKERKKNEERLEKLRQEELVKKKQEKTVQSFASFFLKKDKVDGAPSESHRSGSDVLNAFQVKSNMRLAPLSRSHAFDSDRRKALEAALQGEGAPGESYLKDIHAPEYVKGSCPKTWTNLDTKDDDGEDEVEILDEEEDIPDEISGTVNADDPRKGRQDSLQRAKLLQFHENQRPPYWGTWSKRSHHICGRRPFATDAHFFDYDYDSDDDWEEEEQGESLSDDEADKEEEEDPQDEEEDDGFFVGHGVLDKDEILHEDTEEENNGEEGYNEDLEIMKQKLKAQAFEEEYKRKKPVKLKPKVFGCLWIHDSSINAFAAEQLSKILSPMSAVVLHEGSSCIPTAYSSSLSSPLDESLQATPNIDSKGGGHLKSIPEEAMFDLIRLVHANSLNKVFLAKEFSAFWEKRRSSKGNDSVSTPVKPAMFPRKVIMNKIGEIAEYKKVTELNRRAWIVKEELLSKYVPADAPLEIPNSTWSYHLEQPNDINSKSTTTTPSTPTASGNNNEPGSGIPTPIVAPTPKSLITNFVKVLTPEERERQLKDSRGGGSMPKKRATLICLSKPLSSSSVTDPGEKSKDVQGEQASS